MSLIPTESASERLLNIGIPIIKTRNDLRGCPVVTNFILNDFVSSDNFQAISSSKEKGEKEKMSSRESVRGVWTNQVSGRRKYTSIVKCRPEEKEALEAEYIKQGYEVKYNEMGRFLVISRYDEE